MKSRFSRIGLISCLMISLVFLTTLLSGLARIMAAPQKILQKRPIQKQMTITGRPSVTSVTPQKAVLIQGGEAVVVEAKGSNLPMIGSAQVTRAGSPAAGLEASLDQSQLPTMLKVSLKASSQAQVASDYLLTILDANQKKLFDVPNTVLGIEVQAPAPRISPTKKTEAFPKALTTTKEVAKQKELVTMLGLPDIIISSITLKNTESPYLYISKLVLKNIGVASASFDGDSMLVQFKFPSARWGRILTPHNGLYLAPGQEWIHEHNLSVYVGDQSVVYIADPLNKLVESNERNNTYTLVFPAHSLASSESKTIFNIF